MAIIEGFRVQNYRALRDVTLGRVSGGRGEALTPFTVVIGKNGVGKSSLFDAFGFVADGLATDHEAAGRGRAPAKQGLRAADTVRDLLSGSEQ